MDSTMITITTGIVLTIAIIAGCITGGCAYTNKLIADGIRETHDPIGVAAALDGSYFCANANAILCANYYANKPQKAD